MLTSGGGKSAPPQDTTARLNAGAAAEEGVPKRFALRWLSSGGRSTYQLLEGAKLVVGRAPDADVLVDALGVSRHHAEFHLQGPIYALRDLGSTNGTHVNGVRIEHAGLSSGDVVRFGSMVGIVMRVDPTTLDAPDVVELAPGVLFAQGLSAQLEQLRRVAPSDLPVSIWGETGVGKECIARAVHLLSGRAGPFHAVNCAALPPALAEAELFGHRRGAFSGAEQAGLGHFRAAHGGTLLLDELPDLAASVQAKLLRALQEGAVTPLGETRSVPVDVRLVAACQQSPFELIEKKHLRQDLVARLNGLTLEVPPLRERRADVAIFLSYFLNRHSGGRPPAVEAELLERLLLHDWPSNVRELELVTRRMVVMHGHSPTLRLAHLPEELRRLPRVPEQPGIKQVRRKDHDRRVFADELRRHEGNVARAAAAAGISRQRAYRLLGKQSVDAFLSSGSAEPDAGGHEPRH